MLAAVEAALVFTSDEEEEDEREELVSEIRTRVTTGMIAEGH